MAGTRETSIRSYNYFVDSAIVAGGYGANKLEFVDLDDGTPFLSHSILIINDGAAAITFRFTADPGSGVPHGLVSNGETLQLDFKRARQIYLTGTALNAYRLWAW